MRRTSLAGSFRVAALLSAVMLGTSAQADLVGPSPYLQAADSPFATVDFSAGYFVLEDMEDSVFDPLGVVKSDAAIIGPASNVDSVDADDGVIDGFGTAGRSLYSTTGFITFTFDPNALGNLPTHAGVAWTDGTNSIIFEAFDQDGVSLGQLTGNHADSDYRGQTGEDRFYGAVNAAGGISSIQVSNGSLGIELDHLQYGYVPEPATALLLCVLAAAGLRRR